MPSADPILVLREGVHGMPVEAYAAALRERLPDATVRLARTPGEEREGVADAAVVTGPRVDEDLIERAEELRLFACAFAGTDHLPLEALEARDVAVTSAAGVHASNVAEQALAALLAFVRRLDEGWSRSRRAEWRHYRTRELSGSTVTVVGLGAIGSAVVDRLVPFEVTTLGVRGHPDRGGPTDEVFGPHELHDALARTDHLVLSCPLTEETRGLIGAEEFTTLSADAVLVNVARGEVVDTDALVSALRWNEIEAAALDVTDPEPLPPDHPLWSLENVLVTPHNAGHTPRYYERLADIVAENVARLERGESLRNGVA